MVLKKLLLAVLLLLIPLLPAIGQTDSVFYTKDQFKGQLQELKAHYGQKKTMPAEYELGILVALSHYPELINATIIFVEEPIHATMMARPQSAGIFDEKNRIYIVYINNCKKNTGFLPSELSFNQFVGVMGHELGHVCYYTGCSNLRLFMDGFGYYFKEYRRSFEAGTDRITMDHGLGWQLIDFTNYLRQNKLSHSYAKKKRTIYLGSQDLLQEMRKRQGASR